MRLTLALAAGLFATPTGAQSSAHLGIQLEVLPAAVRITVTSAAVDFGQQHANAGIVVLDPATGEISRKAAGRHQVGQVQVAGRAGTAYAITVTPSGALESSHGRIDFGLRWAQSFSCASGAFEAIANPGAVTGHLGPEGCSALRFGGQIALNDAPEGRYEGSLEVRILSL